MQYGKDKIVSGQVWINNTPNIPKRATSDVYITPSDTVKEAFNFLLQREPKLRAYRTGSFMGNSVFSRPYRVLDIGAGEGAWGIGAKELWPHCFLSGIESREIPRPKEYDHWAHVDIRLWDRTYKGDKYDICISNPPYCLQNECAEIGLNHLADGGFQIMLLPLSFLAGQKRRNTLFKSYPPKYVGIFSKRISWDGSGRVPPRDHILAIWEGGWKGNFQGFFIGQT